MSALVPVLAKEDDQRHEQGNQAKQFQQRQFVEFGPAELSKIDDDQSLTSHFSSDMERPCQVPVLTAFAS